jgi:hypothetical protein
MQSTLAEQIRSSGGIAGMPVIGRTVHAVRIIPPENNADLHRADRAITAETSMDTTPSLVAVNGQPGVGY